MGRTILLADDSITIQKIVNLTFSGEGIDVVTVGNGDAALKKVYDVRPDLVLADIFMPGKNGYEVCEHIKNDPELVRIPVILLVGAFEPFDNNEAARVKADGHLTKPFEIKVLISAVNSLISAAEEERVAERLKDPAAVAEIPSVSEASSIDELAQPVEPEVDMPESVPAPPVVMESAVYVTETTNMAESLHSVTTGIMLEETAVELGQRQGQVIAKSRAEVPALRIEDSDPLGLYTTEAALGEASGQADLATDSRSLVVDIWEHRTTCVEEIEVLPTTTEEKPKGQDAAVTAELKESLDEEETTDAFAAESSPEFVEEDLSTTRKAVFASETFGSKMGERPLVKESDQSELVDLVAHKVIEKLSREVIEKIAWEVIPDMAEIIIKEYTASHLKSPRKIQVSAPTLFTSVYP